MWYWLFKYVLLGPLLSLLGRPKVEAWNMFRAPGRRYWPVITWR